VEYINPALTCGTPPRLTTKIRSRHLQNRYLQEPSQYGKRTRGRHMKPRGNPSLGSVHPPARKRGEALQERHHHQPGRVSPHPNPPPPNPGAHPVTPLPRHPDPLHHRRIHRWSTPVPTPSVPYRHPRQSNALAHTPGPTHRQRRSPTHFLGPV
jgi:hypothetical protein